ncbi:MAG: hypothetical protein ACOCUR_01095 [Nanoarchaeota archaeon]
MAIFFVPNAHDKRDKITKSDISGGKLRITKSNKRFFPDEECEISIVYNDEEKKCKFDGDSLIIGRELMKNIGIQSTDILEFRVEDDVYYLSK